MKMPDGGTRPAYNVQFATDTATGLIVGVDVTQVGSDAGELTPMVTRIEAQHGVKPQEVLADGGFATLAEIESLTNRGSWCTSR